MGAMQNNPAPPESGKGRRRSKQASEVSWNDIDPTIVAAFIDLAERGDGAIRFGRSRDRSVYSLGFYLQGSHFTEWIQNGDERDMALERLYLEVTEDFEIQGTFPGKLF